MGRKRTETEQAKTEYYITRIRDYYSAAWSSTDKPGVNLFALPNSELGGGLFRDPVKCKKELDRYLRGEVYE